MVRASLSLQLTAANPLAEAAIAAAGKAVQHKLSLRVEPSSAPTSIVMMNGDEQLPIIVSKLCKRTEQTSYSLHCPRCLPTAVLRSAGCAASTCMPHLQAAALEALSHAASG